MKNDGTRTIINGRVAEHPYYYYRGGLLHCKYTVDDCVELTKEESARLKVAMTSSVDKQEVLAKEYNLQTKFVGKTVYDGIIKVDEMAEAKRKSYEKMAR